MCAKFNRLLARLIPEGAIKEGIRASYYSLYYNRKHFKENNFRVFYKKGHFEYEIDDGVTFKAYENMADELKRSLFGYCEKYKLNRGDVVVDCGAYFGEFTLYAAKAVDEEGAVIAFEPDPQICDRLKKNVELNELSNVIIVNKGVWSEDKALAFTSDDVRGHSFLLDRHDAAALELPVVSLDSELERLGARRVNFIKMDVEGAELEAIRGAEKTLKYNNAQLAIASYHVVNGKKTYMELEKILSGFGYRVETSNPGHLTTYASK